MWLCPVDVRCQKSYRPDIMAPRRCNGGGPANEAQGRVAAAEGLVAMENTLYYGDNLDILKRYVKEESVDLIYLDPPFKSNQHNSYQILTCLGD